VAFPTDGFDSAPISFTTGLSNHDESDITVTGSLIINGDGSAFTLSEDQTQALFIAATNAVKGYLLGLFPDAYLLNTSVRYSAITDIAVS
jgi:hypothetical protein